MIVYLTATAGLAQNQRSAGGIAFPIPTDFEPRLAARPT
jgi:hypothetical protein